MKLSWIRLIFWLSAFYDFILGLAFLLAANAIFDHFEVTPPNHLGYVHFPALLLILFAGMYAKIALDPVRHHEFIAYGIGLKVAYVAVAFFHHFTGGIPPMWLPFAYIDLGFVIVFYVAWRATR